MHSVRGWLHPVGAGGVHGLRPAVDNCRVGGVPGAVGVCWAVVGGVVAVQGEVPALGSAVGAVDVGGDDVGVGGGDQAEVFEFAQAVLHGSGGQAGVVGEGGDGGEGVGAVRACVVGQADQDDGEGGGVALLAGWVRWSVPSGWPRCSSRIPGPAARWSVVQRAGVARGDGVEAVVGGWCGGHAGLPVGGPVSHASHGLGGRDGAGWP